MQYTRPLLLSLLPITLLLACEHDALSGSLTPPPPPQAQPVPYQDYRQLVQPIVNSMTLEQKLGQMTLPKYTFIKVGDDSSGYSLDYSMIQDYALGGVLAAGGEIPDGSGAVDAGMYEASAYLTATHENWAPITQGSNEHAPVITLKDGQQVTLPLLIGIDAVHGMHETLGNVIFPHNIGLSMTNDPDLLTQIGQITANDLLIDGFNWTYAPTAAVSHNPYWGRSYETLGSVPEKIRVASKASVVGLQQFKNGIMADSGVLATIKHFIGDGATLYGIDQGNTVAIDMPHFLDVNKQGYEGAVDADVGSLMVSYSALNGIPMTIEQSLKPQLKGNDLLEQPFNGFIVSDYGAVTNISDRGLPSADFTLPYVDALTDAINGGIDMIMISSTANSYSSIADFLTILTSAVNAGWISEQRIDEAVTNILAVKYAMGLIHVDAAGKWQHKFKTLSTDRYTQDEKIAVAVKAAEKSQVLLKNDNNLLPITPENIKYIVFVGDDSFEESTSDGGSFLNIYQNYNNIGAQAGGWTMAWQGVEGNTLWQDEDDKASSGATSIYEGIAAAFPDATLLMPSYELLGSTDTERQEQIDQAQAAFLSKLDEYQNQMTSSNTLIIGVLAERPYAEFMGDINNPYCVDGQDGNNGCLYALSLNPYLPDTQPQTLAIDYNAFDKSVINQVRSYNYSTTPMISILLSGRARIIDNNDDDEPSPLAMSDAFIAAWLPGPAAGTAIANSIVGDYLFCNGKTDDGVHCRAGSPNTLSINWVASDESLDTYPIYEQGEGFVAFPDPLFEINYGLATSSSDQ